MYKYKFKESNETMDVYESLDELLNEDIDWVTEDNDNYYIALKKESTDDTVWKINKSSNRVEYMQYPAYIFDVMDKATPIDPKTLKRAS